MNLKILMLLIALTIFSGCSAQYSYHHGDCDIAIDSLRDLPQGVKVTVSDNCILTFEAGELRNGSSEAVQVLDIVSSIVKEMK